MSSLACRFGDEEEWEDVPCLFDQQAGTVLCKRPLGKSNGHFIGTRMVAKGGSGVELPMVLNREGEDGQHQSLSTPPSNESRNKARCSSTHHCRNYLIEIAVGCIGETMGTMLFTFIICTILASSIITGSHLGVWQVALPSGLSVSVAIYLSIHISDGHLNPAVSLAFAVTRWKQFRLYKLLPYIVSQVLGAFLAAACVYLLYFEAIKDYEKTNNITRGEVGSQLTASIFARYFPNPLAFDPLDSTTFDLVPLWKGVLVEGFGTFVLVFVLFGLSHPANTIMVKYKGLFPLLIGLTVAMIISIIGQLTQAGINPAFDFGPRLFAAIAGWGRIAIPGPRHGFWVYLIGPFVGGTLGGMASDGMQGLVRILNRNKHS